MVEAITSNERVHDLKCWPEYFQAICDGSKTFEHRYNDRGYRVGDKLILREWDRYTQQPTGRVLERYVCYLLDLSDANNKPGFVVMSIARAKAETPAHETEYEQRSKLIAEAARTVAGFHDARHYAFKTAVAEEAMTQLWKATFVDPLPEKAAAPHEHWPACASNRGKPCDCNWERLAAQKTNDHRTGALPPEGLITGRAVPTALRAGGIEPSDDQDVLGVVGRDSSPREALHSMDPRSWVDRPEPEPPCNPLPSKKDSANE